MKAMYMATIMGVALLVSCQHGTRPAVTPHTETSTATRLQKLGCHEVCHRTFQDCMTQMLLATGKITRQQLKRFVRTGLMGMAKVTGYAGCMRRCQKGQTRGVQEKTLAVKRCLRKRSCAAYAACMIPPRSASR